MAATPRDNLESDNRIQGDDGDVSDFEVPEPGPSKKARSGAATYKTKFIKHGSKLIPLSVK